MPKFRITIEETHYIVRSKVFTAASLDEAKAAAIEDSANATDWRDDGFNVDTEVRDELCETIPDNSI